MAYVITEPCIAKKDGECTEVCPVDCIHPRKDESGFANEPQLYINPDECIACGACQAVCPVSAIFPEEEVPEKWQSYVARNSNYFKK
jgi:ferredoxin